MNEKERADHADSRYKLLQSQNSQIEKVVYDILLFLMIQLFRNIYLCDFKTKQINDIIIAQRGVGTKIC